VSYTMPISPPLISSPTYINIRYKGNMCRWWPVTWDKMCWVNRGWESKIKHIQEEVKDYQGKQLQELDVMSDGLKRRAVFKCTIIGGWSVRCSGRQMHGSIIFECRKEKKNNFCSNFDTAKLTRTGPDRCWINEYSWLSDSTHTYLSSH
jgi:hypothetical protein